MTVVPVTGATGVHDMFYGFHRRTRATCSTSMWKFDGSRSETPSDDGA